MLIDARAIPKNTRIETDLCIVGAGAAGITLARALSGSSIKVILLESGGLEFDPETQSLYRGQNVGLPTTPPDASRLRYFGGTTNHWNGTCRPLDAIDFRRRDWVPNSGWPFERDELLPYYVRAQPILELGPFVYSDDEWGDERDVSSIFDGESLSSAIFQQGPPTRFNPTYLEEVRQAANVTIYLHANVLEFITNASGRSVKHARVSSLEKNQFQVSARRYVLATGGIENARLLLLSNKVNRRGLGNDHGLVGRFLMDHPHAGRGTAGLVSLVSPTDYSRLLDTRHRFQGDETETKRVRYWNFIAPTEEGMRREKILNCGLTIKLPDQPVAPGVLAGRHLRDIFADADWPEDIWEDVENVISDFGSVVNSLSGKSKDPLALPLGVSYWSEPCPNPDSRVYLSAERDQLGQRRVVVDWRMTELDQHTFEASVRLLANELGRHGLGRLGMNPEIADKNWHRLLAGSWHHIGTTRMHGDPKRGVVDANCLVHGISNLYIAGSSVFPTAGYTPPTLTIVALALRLADHIKQEMG